MNQPLLDTLKLQIDGDVMTDEETLRNHSTDKSLFQLIPEVVVYPKTPKDLKTLINFVAKHKKHSPSLSLTARAAGTDMTGGDLSESIVVSFTKYFNHDPQIHTHERYATVEPGLYFRDLEKFAALHGLSYPAYPSSRQYCAMGGIVNNNAGGEKTLRHGKAADFVNSLSMYLADGNEYEFKRLSIAQLQQKRKSSTFEGKLYRKLFTLIDRHYDLLQQAKPKVSKNAAGYALWDVYNKEQKTFDMTKLFVGAQGTLGLMSKANIRLMPQQTHSAMMILTLKNPVQLATIIQTILSYHPETLESYDDHTLQLALKYFNNFSSKLGSRTPLGAFMHFLPEFKLKYSSSIPEMTILAEFTGETYEEIAKNMKELIHKLQKYDVQLKIAPNEQAERKYWEIRRNTYALLRKKMSDRFPSPFIDDVVVPIESLPEFLPKFREILHKYPVVTAVQAHIGNGNFHVFPLLDLSNQNDRVYITHLAEEVFDLVIHYKGSITGEQNDGLIRTPYLNKQYHKKILTLFTETKKIFDPLQIFNPGKKVNGNLEYALSHLRTSW